MQQKLSLQKKKVAVIMLIAFALTMVCPVSAFAANFSDVPSNHWAIQQIDRMNARGIIVGYEDGTNRPNNPVTQFEALAMATRMMGLEYNEATHKGTYVSFKYPDWTGAYSVAVLAQEAGLVDVSDFNHSSAASREWIAKLLIKIMDAENEMNSVANESLAFSDTASIGSKYLNYVKLAYDKGLIGGYTDGTFKPKNTVTRAEMSAFLCRVEDKLNADLNNVVRGEVTAITGVNVTIAGTDGKTHSLYATTNSVLYSNLAKKMGVTELEVGDSVYAVYKNNLLLYLEERNEAYNVTKPTVVTNLEGTISSVIPAKNIIVVTDDNGDLQTVVVDKNTKINKENSNVALDFEDLLTEMPVRISIDKDDQTANQIIIEETTSGQRSGTIHSVDVYDNVIVMDEKTGLVSYRMSKNIEVSVSGMLTATTSSLKDGDLATYTVADGVMTAIAVGGSSDTYGGNATVKSVDTTKRMIIYETSDGALEVAYYSSGQTVKFKNGDSGTMKDVQSGDKINISVADNQVTSITITSRKLADDGTLKGVVVTRNAASGKIELTIDGKSKTYDVSNNVVVYRYDTTSSNLNTVYKGETVSLEMSNDVVTEIHVNEEVEMVVYVVYSNRVILEDNDNNRVTAYASTTDFYIDGVYTNDLDELHEGDEVVATFVGRNAKEVNVVEQVITGTAAVRGEVTDVNTTKKTITVKTSNGKTETVSFTSGSYVLDNGSTSSSISRIAEGDRVMVSAGTTGKSFTIMSEKSGKVSFALANTFKFLDNNSVYQIASGCYSHYANSTTTISLNDNNSMNGKTATIYYVDDVIYEIEVKR